MNISQIEQLHNDAMSIADDADILKHHGEVEEARQLYGKAYAFEREAAQSAIDSGIEELSTGILIKSAAFLAYDGGLYRESERMVGLALSRNLPEDIMDEMRDLLENLHFARHLKLNGITLSDSEVQIVVAGNGVAHGMAREDDVNERISTFKQMAIRTAERSKGRKFRTNGQPPKEIKDICVSYLSIPRAASFAVTMRIGETSDKSLETFQGSTNALIEDIATNLILANSGNISALKERIKDQSYFENFISLAKEFAPDGERVNLVGLTFKKDGSDVPVELTTPKIKYREVVTSIASLASSDEAEGKESIVRESLLGVLYAANSKSDEVKLLVGEKKYTIKVPEGLAEIVRKYFDTEVVALVSHNKANDSFKLISVDPQEEEPQLF